MYAVVISVWNLFLTIMKNKMYLKINVLEYIYSFTHES